MPSAVIPSRSGERFFFLDRGMGIFFLQEIDRDGHFLRMNPELLIMTTFVQIHNTPCREVLQMIVKEFIVILDSSWISCDSAALH
jgi:hypothetical protein